MGGDVIEAGRLFLVSSVSSRESHRTRRGELAIDAAVSDPQLT